jgi:hypothetical protein
MKFFSLENKLLVGIFFLFLLIYLVFRAFFLSPYCDEISTLFEYIESNRIIESTLKDSSANNHLLNTLLSKFFYFIFGDNFFFLRLPNILAFILYFYSIKHVVLRCINLKYQFLTFVSLNTIVWIFEYFGYLRGYGLALGMLFCSISFFLSWLESKTVLKLFYTFLFIWLSIFANLSFFNTSLILFSYAVVLIICNYKKLSKKDKIQYFILIISFVIALLPLVVYSFKLKNAGALWWGNLDGLWEGTGHYLSEITFFITNDFIKYLIIFIILIFGILASFKLKKLGLIKFISSYEGFFYVIFFGNIVFIEILAQFFKVNYPRDRAAIQLVPLIIIVYVISLQNIKSFNVLLCALLFFPFSFLMKMHLDSSVYQNNLRISNKTTQFIKNHLKYDSSYSVYGLLELPLYYQFRNHEIVKLFNSEKCSNLVESNYIIVENDYRPPSYFKREMIDEISNISIYKNTKGYKYSLVKDTSIHFIKSQNDLLLFRGTRIDSLFKSDKFKVEISGKIEFKDLKTPFHLILTLGDSLNPLHYYHDSDFSKINVGKKQINFVWNSPVYTLEKGKTDLLIYFWNIDRHFVQYNDLHLRILKVNDNHFPT